MHEVLDMLIELSEVEVKVESDTERMRPSDVPVLLGNGQKFRDLTGWKPKIPFDRTLWDIMDYWRENL